MSGIGGNIKTQVKSLVVILVPEPYPGPVPGRDAEPDPGPNPGITRVGEGKGPCPGENLTPGEESGDDTNPGPVPENCSVLVLISRGPNIFVA